MTIFMIEETSDNELLLHDENFPSHYINKQHPQDYLISEIPIKELFYHKTSFYSRLFVRLSFKIDDKFIPISCICDTGAPKFLYLTQKARNVLKKRIKQDELLNEYMEINLNNISMKIGLSEPLTTFNDVNIIGILLLEKLGLIFNSSSFELTNLGEFI